MLNEEEKKELFDTLRATHVKMEGVESRMGRIEVAVLGDDEARIDGYGKRIDKVEREVSRVEVKVDNVNHSVGDVDKKISWMKGGLWGLTSLVGLIGLIFGILGLK